MGCPAPHGASQLLSTLHTPVLSGLRDRNVPTICHTAVPRMWVRSAGQEGLASPSVRPVNPLRAHLGGAQMRCVLAV